MLHQLSSLCPHPESVPINLLARVDGTPLGDRPDEDPLEMVRTIATARILMPASFVRLSAGRASLSPEAQALCFMAGANSVFLGDVLLTTPNPAVSTSTAACSRSSGFGCRRRRMPDGLAARVFERLHALREDGLERSLRPPSGIDLSSNDYLGLSTHPRVTQAMIDAIARDGAGSTGSRLLRGDRTAFTDVERKFAAFKGTERALYFSSGYLANLAVLTTIAERGDVIFSDELNHASLIDGTRLSSADCVIVPHSDVTALEQALVDYSAERQAFVVTESLFSMDGDIAPLADYAALCRATGAALIVDEAHAVGICGTRGSGMLEQAGIDPNSCVSINTAGKALGVSGAR